VVLSTALVAAFLQGTAYAQEPPRERSLPPDAPEEGAADEGADEGAEETSATSEGRAPLPDRVTYADGWTWRPVTPSAARPRFVSIRASTEGWGLAMDADGGVWRSRTGDTWYSVLDPVGLTTDGPDKEAMLLEVESVMEDFFQGDGELLEAESDSDVAESNTDDLNQLQGGQTDVLGVGDLLFEDGEGRGSSGAVVWIHQQDPDIALVARSDGLWRSRDAGRTFEQVDAPWRFTAFAAASDGLVVAGTDSGLLYSLDGGRSWIDQDDALDGRVVRQLHRGERGYLYAVADGSVYSSTDAAFWEVLPLDPMIPPVEAVIEDPNIDDALWVAARKRLYRLDRGEAELLGSHPLGDLSEVILTGQRGQLLWAGADGIWESRDGGVGWRAVSAGLPHPEVNGVAMFAAGPVSVGEAGVFRLSDKAEAVVVGEADAEAPPGPELSYLMLMDRALSRPGMDPFALGARASASAARLLLPQLVVKAQYNDDRYLDAYYTTELASGEWTGYNTGGTDSGWWVQLELRWNATSLDEGFTVADPFVLNDQIYSGMEDTNYVASASANVTGKAASYRTRVADELARLYADRQRLDYERAALADEDLLERVQHELALQEIDARIDAYTDNALHAVLTGYKSLQQE